MRSRWTVLMLLAAVVALTMLAAPSVVLADDDDSSDDSSEASSDESSNDEVPFPVAVMLIELTESDIELQVFADGHWGSFRLTDPRDRMVFDSRVWGKLRRQYGVSESYWASVPSHFLEDEPNFDEPISAFLARWPEGLYEFESRSLDGDDYESQVRLSHLMPALPEIVSPVSETEDPVEVDSDAPLLIDWNPVTTDFLHGAPVDIVEYQVIVDLVDPERDAPWIDGSTRRALINLPANVTEFSMDPRFLTPGSGYEFEVLAIERNGNATISEGEFVTSD